jgi:peptide-methionine (R)-S-oxide reductase
VKRRSSAATPHFDLTPPSEAQLRKLIDGLSDEERRVMLHHGDEAPFCGVFLAEKRDGVFTCRLCGLPLFKAGTKFESGTGWPSFFSYIPGHLETKTDFKLILPRTEYHCARCEGHQGHVFDDGPKPTGLRYCMDGFALVFHPAGPQAS